MANKGIHYLSVAHFDEMKAQLAEQVGVKAATSINDLILAYHHQHEIEAHNGKSDGHSISAPKRGDRNKQPNPPVGDDVPGGDSG